MFHIRRQLWTSLFRIRIRIRVAYLSRLAAVGRSALLVVNMSAMATADLSVMPVVEMGATYRSAGWWISL
jgi:hypothetical protein